MKEDWKLVESAVNDAEELIASIAEQSEPAAERVAGELTEAFRLLARWPQLGTKRAGVLDADVRCYVSGAYLLFYRASTVPLEIGAILHGARDILFILEDHEL